MTLGEKQETIKEYCNGRPCRDCVLRRQSGHSLCNDGTVYFNGSLFNAAVVRIVERAYAALVDAGEASSDVEYVGECDINDLIG